MSVEARDAWNKAFSRCKPSRLPLEALTEVFHCSFLQSFLSSFRNRADLSILEAGCGSGKFIASLALMGHKATAVDFSSESLRIVRQYEIDLDAERSNVALCLIQGDISTLCFKEKSFDLVFNEGVVEHWLKQEERIEVIKEMKRVTRIGGVVGVVVPNGRHPFMGLWKILRYPGYFDEIVPAWFHHSAKILKHEMESAGLDNVEVDGIDPYKSISLWPRKKILELLAIGCDKFLPHPKWLRKRWGIHLVAKGYRRD